MEKIFSCFSTMLSLKIKQLFYQQKCTYSGIAKNCNLGLVSYGKTIGKCAEQRRWTFFYTGRGSCVELLINKEAIGGNWEFEVQWLFIGWAIDRWGENLPSYWCGNRVENNFLLDIQGWFLSVWVNLSVHESSPYRFSQLQFELRFPLLIFTTVRAFWANLLKFGPP